MTLRSLLLALAIVLPAAHAFGQDVRTGHEAYKSGDYARAMEILRPHAERGHPGAQFLVGLMYVRGDGVSADDAEGLKWMRMSAERGVTPAEYVLGTMYFAGVGGSKDLAEAEKWLLRAAEKGYSKAQYSLGFLLYFGTTMALWHDSMPEYSSRDPVRGFAWLSLAAESGMNQAVETMDRVQPDLTHEEEAKARQLIAELRARIASRRR